MTAAAAAVAAVALTAAPALAVGPNQNATATAQIVKPLTLSWVGNLNFGSIIVQDNGTISMDATGAVTCSASLTCSGTVSPAEYKVTGTNNQVVQINKPNVTLTNSANPGTDLTLVLNGYGPTSVTLPNSGSTGSNFKLGGSIAIPANVKDGTYTGTLDVTVNY
jgi:spore coat protein U-like protein